MRWLIVLASVCCASVTTAAEPARRPNILFILSDDQSYKTVGCYPEAWPWVKTPHIDALARSGMRFHGAYLGAWCMPSRVFADWPSPASHPVDEDGRAVPRQHLRPETVPVLAGAVPQEWLS